MDEKELPSLTNKDQTSVEDANFLVVGIGASAGGINALQHFFENVPDNSYCAYVVILHLSPDHDSKLAEVLSTVSKIPVIKVTEKIKVLPDHIYVISPNKHLLMLDDFIAISENLTIEERRAPVDIFFRTLGDNLKNRAVAVILSGTGANGSMGLKRVKECGGIAFVQSPREAEYNEMPRNAIETELIDEVLPVADIPRHIIAYRRNLAVTKIVPDNDIRPEDQHKALRDIFLQIRMRTGHDFTNYKRPTLLRRIERRINIRNLANLPAYAEYLNQHPDETVALLKDLLISVTNFFRDTKAFQAIETDILPKIIQGKTVEEEIRIWVAGCATGEEAYSFAMLCAERTHGVIDAPKVQIFATDIDESAIAIAREGFYTINDAADITPERLSRFFNKEEGGYRVKREIREMVLFAIHNFIKDPPFSRLHIVSCRNVLIYLNHVAQHRLIETFHFALRPQGFLFLGTSESVDGASELYAVYNRENHIFQARQASARNYPVPESVPNFKFPSQDLLQKLEEKEIRTTDRITYAALHQRLLEQYAPPSVVIDETYDIVHMSEKVGKYFQVSGGEPTQNVLKLVRPELRLEMRAALYQAVHQQASIETRDLKLMIDGQTKTIHLHIRPVIETGDTAKGFILIIFQETVGADNEPALIQLSTEPMAIQLEEELVRIQGQLRTSTEQYEFQAEELKASNEELQAMNEELRSAAEELETSKEELQSINEELRTVNQELKVKVEESAHVSNNFQNLINSAEVGTIFLDRSFRIKFFTPSIKNLFNLITTDFGRPITDITNKLNYPDLLNDAEIVLEKLAIQEREINSVDGRAFMMRLLPYRTDDRINGVVITFFDITQRRQAEEALRQSEEHLRLLIESASDYAIFTLDRERRVLTWSKGAEAMMGYTEQEIIGKPADIVFTAEDRLQHAPEVEIEKAEQEGRAKNERWHVRKDGSKFWGSGSVSSLRNNDGNLVGLVKIMRDLTEARKLEAAKFFLASIVESSQDPIFTMNFDSQITSWNKAAENMYGYREEEVLGKHVSMITLPQNLEKAIEDNKTIQHSGEVKVFDSVRVIKGDIELQVQVMLSPVKNAEEQVIGISAISRDITEQKHFMEELARQVNQRTLELQRSNDDLLQFAHVASHDLKEPVRKILTFNNRLADEFNHLLPEKARMYIDKINHSAERMNSMIEGILNYSSSKNEHHIFENVDINKIIEQIESELELLIRKKNGVVNKPQLPGIKGISVLVYQLFYNLINNALKFSKANEPAVIDINYDFEKRDDKEFFKITLSDNGIGFEPEFKNRIFEIFTRLNTKDEFEGTGIGLALCKKIMERHGGHIYATSELGQGATFILLFPH